MRIEPVNGIPVTGDHILYLTTDELETIKRALIFRSIVVDQRAEKHGYVGVHKKASELVYPLTDYLNEYKGNN